MDGYDLHDRVVLITGGSKGLGLAMAREFGNQGARVAICARSQEELGYARVWLGARGVRAEAFECDVRDQAAVEVMARRVEANLGYVDVLVNNAGVIQVGPFENQQVEDFKEAMDTMFWGMVYPTFAVLPFMKSRGGGRIVNITSIGGKISAPHLLPYNAAKFAAVGFSEGLRPELSRSGIGVVTVVPGLMRTGSFVNAVFKGRQDQEFRLFAMLASLPMTSIDADTAAKRIVRATQRNEGELVLTLPANLGMRAHGLFPGLTAKALSFAGRLLPKPAAQPDGAQCGREVMGGVDHGVFNWATTLGREAAQDYQPPSSRTTHRLLSPPPGRGGP